MKDYDYSLKYWRIVHVFIWSKYIGTVLMFKSVSLSVFGMNQCSIFASGVLKGFQPQYCLDEIIYVETIMQISVLHTHINNCSILSLKECSGFKISSISSIITDHFVL